MAHRVSNRVRFTSTTTGTGSLTSAGAVTGFQDMAASLTADSDTGFFFAELGADWEVFLGTRSSSTVLARTTIYASSNAGAAVSWPAGVKNVCGDIPARFAELLNTIEITVADSGTPDIGAVQGCRVVLNGTTTITSFGTSTHKLRFIRFAGARTLTYNATSLILPGAANITTAAGDCAIATSDASGNWTVRHYTRAATFLDLSSALTWTAAQTIQVQSATAFTVGRLGSTTPALQVNSNTASSITGLLITAAASGGGLAVKAQGETNVALTIDANGSGTITLNGTGTGNVTTPRVFTNTNATDSTTQATGSVILTGGLGVAKGLNAGATTGSAGGVTGLGLSSSHGFGAASGVFVLGINTGGTGAQNMVRFLTGNNANEAGKITTNTTTTAYVTSSDSRLKTPVCPFTQSGDVIDRLQVREFTWKATGDHDIGMFAQEVYDVYPLAVAKPNPKFANDPKLHPWALENAKLVPVLIAEVKSLRARMAKMELDAA